jgi:hypothetical protein
MSESKRVFGSYIQGVGVGLAMGYFVSLNQSGVIMYALVALSLACLLVGYYFDKTGG